MKKLVVILTTMILCAAMVLTGCSKNAESASPSSFAPQQGIHGKSDSFSQSESYNAAPGESKQDSDAQNTDIFAGRKVIRNANLTIEALEFDEFLRSVTEKTLSVGGYIQSNNVESRSYKYYGLRYAEMVVRIPADKLDEFLAAVDGLGNIISRHEDVDDVTDTYVDIEARLSSIRTEYDTLLKLLADAEDLDTIILLQNRLSDVRYQIESYEAKLRSYDSLVAYSTVRMSISEVERETPVEKESFGKELSVKFSDSLASVGYGFREFALWFLGNLPVIIVWAVIIAVIVIVIVVIVKRSSRRRKEKKAAEVSKAE